MDVVEIKKMYDKGYTIDYIANEYYKFKNSKIQQNYFNINGNLVVTKKYKKQQAYDYVYKVLYNYHMENIKKAD